MRVNTVYRKNSVKTSMLEYSFNDLLLLVGNISNIELVWLLHLGSGFTGSLPYVTNLV